jgi:predicted PurR-regulated permease PerM
VFIPAILALYLQGNVYGALGLLISAIAIIVLVDNILSPYFFSQGLEVSAVFVLLAMLGGIIFLGPLGFVLGPLILSMFLALIHIYSKVGAKDDST